MKTQTLDELIKQLQKIKEEHGGEIPVIAEDDTNTSGYVRYDTYHISKIHLSEDDVWKFSETPAKIGTKKEVKILLKYVKTSI